MAGPRRCTPSSTRNCAESLEDFCREQNNTLSVPVLAPVMKAMAIAFRRAIHPCSRQASMRWTPNISRASTRWISPSPWMTAMAWMNTLADADVIILGVSRTSKTPTCLYLAGRGIKAANIPLVAGHPPPARCRQTQKAADCRADQGPGQPRRNPPCSGFICCSRIPRSPMPTPSMCGRKCRKRGGSLPRSAAR